MLEATRVPTIVPDDHYGPASCGRWERWPCPGPDGHFENGPCTRVDDPSFLADRARLGTGTTALGTGLRDR